MIATTDNVGHQPIVGEHGLQPQIGDTLLTTSALHRVNRTWVLANTAHMSECPAQVHDAKTNSLRMSSDRTVGRTGCGTPRRAFANDTLAMNLAKRRLR